MKTNLSKMVVFGLLGFLQPGVFAATPTTGVTDPTPTSRSSSSTYLDSASGTSFPVQAAPSSAQAQVNVPRLNTSAVYDVIRNDGKETGATPTMAHISEFILNKNNRCDANNTKIACYVSLIANPGDTTTSNIAACPQNYFVVVSTGTSVQGPDSTNTIMNTKEAKYGPVTSAEYTYYTGQGFTCDTPDNLRNNSKFPQSLTNLLPSQASVERTDILKTTLSSDHGSWSCVKPKIVTYGTAVSANCEGIAATAPSVSLGQKYNVGDTTLDPGDAYNLTPPDGRKWKVTSIDRNKVCVKEGALNTGVAGSWCTTPCESGYILMDPFSSECKSVAAYKNQHTYTISWLYCLRNSGFYSAPSSTAYPMPEPQTNFNSPTTVVCGKIYYGNKYWQPGDMSAP